MKKMENLKNNSKKYNIFGMIFLLSNKLETIGNTFLGELTTKQWFLMLTLTNLFETPPTLTQLANTMGTSHQNAKQIAIKLEEKGFLSIERDKEDNRALRIVYTDKIKEYIKVRQDKDQNFIEDFFGVLTEDEINIFNEILFKLMDNIQSMEEKT